MTDIQKASRYTRREVEDILTSRYLRQMFDLDTITGHLVRRPQEPDDYFSDHACKMLCARDVGKVVGSPMKDGYLRTQILGHKWLVHRLIWRMCTGQWPLHEIDHIDGNTANNALNNLRATTHAENDRNAARRKDNTSGVTGVWWDESAGKWFAYIRYNTQLIRLGKFVDFSAAVAARREAEEMYGFHDNHGTRPKSVPPAIKRAQ